MTTTVVNLKDTEYDVYIGRPSIFGNPYTVGTYGTRAEVIELYRDWFYEQLQYPLFYRRVNDDLRGRRLGCYCAPLPCHGDVIVDYLEEHDDK